MVPASVVGKASRRRPAMPLDALAGGRSEKEVKARGIVEHPQAERPILITGRGRFWVIASFADHVGVLAFAKSVRFHPSFERERITVLEIEDAIFSSVLDDEVGAFAVEGHGFIRLLEARVIRATGARLLEGDGTDGDEFRVRRAVEGPGRGGLGGVEGRDAEKKGDYTKHLRLGQGSGGAGSA